MRTAYVVPGLGISGGINVILEHASFLSEKGHEAVIVNAGSELNVSWRNNCCPVVRLADLRAVDALYAKPLDVLVMTGWHTAYAARRTGLTARNYAYFVQSDESRFYDRRSAESPLAMATYGLQMRYLTEAKWIRQWLRDFGHDALYVPNGLDHRLFRPQPPILPKTDRLRVLIEGPLAIDFKKVRDAFAAVRGLDVDVWCVSSAGTLDPWMQPDMFFDAVPISRMPSIYSSCDVLLKLSAVEGFFGPPLEMMACGGTAITSDVTGHDEFMEHGKNGFVVPNGDAMLARQYIKQLMADRQLLRRLQAAGLETAARFSWDASLPAMETWMADFATDQRPDAQSGWFGSRAEQAAFDVCTQRYAAILPDQAGRYEIRTLPGDFTPARLLHLQIEGWAWPAVPVGIDLPGASVVDCAITRSARPDVEAVISSPPGAHAGFRIDALLELDEPLPEPDLSRLAVCYKDGSSVICAEMHPARNSTDDVKAWTSWSYSVDAKVELEADSAFRVMLSNCDEELRLFDPRDPPALGSLHVLQPDLSAPSRTQTVFSTDHLLLYNVLEDADASCVLMTAKGTRPTNIVAVRTLAG